MANKEIFAVDKRHFENVRAIRGFITKIINDRKAAKDENAADIITLLLQDSNYQNAADIIDDIITMFFAGAKTI